MGKFLVSIAAMLALEGSAGAQSSWSTDQFSVSTDNQTPVDIVGGSVQVAWLPGAVSNPASNSTWPSTRIDLAFAPQPGFRLAGERVTFGVDMAVDTYDAPTNWKLDAVGGFKVDINGEYALSGTDSGGSVHRTGSFLLNDPNLVSVLDETTTEGLACPLGHEADGCNFGLDWHFLQAEVAFASFTVTPLLSPVPEPGPVSEWLAALGWIALAGSARVRALSRPAARTA